MTIHTKKIFVLIKFENHSVNIQNNTKIDIVHEIEITINK